MIYHAYSDGACKGNPGPGGWGCVVDAPDGTRVERHGGELATTNNKMELMGAIVALKNTPVGATVKLVTDSQYVIKGITEWMSGWKRRNWQASTGGEVKNQELWKVLDAEYMQRKVSFEWVRGHSGHPENERCDELANMGIGELPGGAEILAAAKAAKTSKAKKPAARQALPKPAPGTSGMLKRPSAPVAATGSVGATPPWGAQPNEKDDSNEDSGMSFEL